VRRHRRFRGPAACVCFPFTRTLLKLPSNFPDGIEVTLADLLCLPRSAFHCYGEFPSVSSHITLGQQASRHKQKSIGKSEAARTVVDILLSKRNCLFDIDGLSFPWGLDRFSELSSDGVNTLNEALLCPGSRVSRTLLARGFRFVDLGNTRLLSADAAEPIESSSCPAMRSNFSDDGCKPLTKCPIAWYSRRFLQR
jgi:hypothetical protein